MNTTQAKAASLRLYLVDVFDLKGGLVAKMAIFVFGNPVDINIWWGFVSTMFLALARLVVTAADLLRGYLP